jgi:hypothetical protein
MHKFSGNFYRDCTLGRCKELSPRGRCCSKEIKMLLDASKLSNESSEISDPMSGNARVYRIQQATCHTESTARAQFRIAQHGTFAISGYFQGD